MKKYLIVFGMLLTMGLLNGCSSDDEKPEAKVLHPGDYVTLYAIGDNETKAIYEPVAYEAFPEWIKTIIDGQGKEYILYLHIYQGERNGEKIYFTCSEADDTYGTVFDKNGERMNLDVDYATFFSETNNWKLVFYYENKLDKE